jgi:hypothetical protein
MSKKNVPYFDDRGYIKNTHHFNKAAQFKLAHGRYTLEVPGSKAWAAFWDEEKRRCLEGYQVGEVRITGYHYFYLNYYPIPKIIMRNGSPDRVQGHPDFWFIDWQFFRIVEYCEKNGLHLGAVKVRGCGYSEKCAAMGARDIMITDYDPSSKEIIERNSFYFASYDQYLGGDGIITKAFNAMDYLNNHTDGRFKKHFKIADKVADYKRQGGIIKKDGTRTKTSGVIEGVVVDKVDKVRGKRGYKLYYEEAGTNKNLVNQINISRPLVELNSGTQVIGTIIAWGTSNVEEQAAEGLKSIIYNPNGFNMVKFRNVWAPPEGVITEEFIESIPTDPLSIIIDHNSPEYYEKGSGVGWFVPAYDVALRDVDGNPLRSESLRRLKQGRAKVLSGQSDQDAMAYIADHPFTIEEALIKTTGRVFSSNKLARQLVDLETGLIKPNIQRGYFSEIRNREGQLIGIKFIEDPAGLIHILDHPSWVIKQPYGAYESLLSNQNISHLYIGGIDSIDQGGVDSESGGKASKLSMVIKKRIDPNNPRDVYNNTYVCLYNHRPDDVREGYKQIAYALMYFNGIALLEYTRINILDYFRDNGFLRYLSKEPDALSRSDNSYRANKNKYGIRATHVVVNFYIEKITQYLTDYGENLYFSAQVKQLTSYTREEKGKFDIVAAMGMTEILEAEYSNKIAKEIVSTKDTLELPVWYRLPNGAKHFGVPGRNNDFIVQEQIKERIYNVKTKTWIYD